MQELNVIAARVKAGKCSYLVHEVSPLNVTAIPTDPETRKMEFAVTGGSANFYCTCKDNIAAHGIQDKDQVELPLFTLRGLMCCLECRFHSGRDKASQEETPC